MKLLLLFLTVFCFKIGYSQGKKSATDSELKGISVFQEKADSKSGASYHERGMEVEKKLKDTTLKSDLDIREKGYIIERSKDIKIEYSPAKGKD